MNTRIDRGKDTVSAQGEPTQSTNVTVGDFTTNHSARFYKLHVGVFIRGEHPISGFRFSRDDRAE